MSLTPEQRSQSARIAAYARWAREDPKPTAERGQQGLLRKFLTEVDAEAAARGERLGDAERNRRAISRRNEHMARLAFSRSKATKRETANTAPIADTEQDAA